MQSFRRYLSTAVAIASIFTASLSFAQTVALTGVRVFGGTDKAPLDNATLLVENGRISAVGPAAQIKIPGGVQQIALKGKTVIPGLVNAHAHVQAETDTKLAVRDDLQRRLQLYASYGVTTVVSLGSSDLDELPGIELRNLQRDGKADGARLYTSGKAVTGRTTEELLAALDRVSALGVDFIKLRLSDSDKDPSLESLRAVIDAAHKKGLRTAVHIFSQQDAQKALVAGVDVIGHSVRNQDVTPEFIAALKARSVPYVPTLTRDLSVFVYESTPEFFKDPFFRRGEWLYKEQIPTLTDPTYQNKVRNNPNAQAIKKALEQAKRNVKLLSDGGVSIAFGTDSGAAGNPGRWQGYFEHVELELLVESGLTPKQTLIAATSAAAKAAGLPDVGSLEVGKLADFVVLNADPLANILNTRQIDSVWIGGKRIP